MGTRDRGPSTELAAFLADLSPEHFWEWARDTRQSDEDVEATLWWMRDGHRYRERPVNVRDFVLGEQFLNQRGEDGEPSVFEPVLQAVQDVCTGNYVESLWTGAIGTGKTTAALLVQTYEAYRLLCLKDPHSTLGLMAGHEIVILFQSLDAKKSEDVDHTRFRAVLDRAPVFKDPWFAPDWDVTSETRFPRNLVAKPVSGLESAGLGLNVIGGVLDELDSMAVVGKSARSRDAGKYDQAIALYNAIHRRRMSRFLRGGSLAGMLCLVGSKQYSGAFTDRKAEEAKRTPGRIYVYDKRVWEIKPKDFGTKRFRVFVGDATRMPRIVPAGDHVVEDADLIHPVPTEFQPEFERDMVGAIRDILGISTAATTPFIMNREAIAGAFSRHASCLTLPQCDFRATTVRIQPRAWKGSERFKRFAHMDAALTGDRFGLAVGHVPGFKRIRRSKAVVEVWPIIRYDLLLAVQAPRGDEIQFSKIRELLYRLRELGLPLRWATADSFQSADMLQQLASQGFLVGEESTDKTIAPYEVFKAALYDGRIEAPEHALAMTELRELERDPKKGKIDHPDHGSKDVADAMACVALGLTMMAEVWHDHDVPLTRMPDTLAELIEKASARKRALAAAR